MAETLPAGRPAAPLVVPVPASVTASPSTRAAVAGAAPVHPGTGVAGMQPTLLEALPANVARGGPLPISFGLVRGNEAPVFTARWAPSEAYRTRAYDCVVSQKPLSRCFWGAP